MQPIKEYEFHKQHEPSIEFEIFPLQEYFKRLGAESNQPHRLDFYMLIFITKGSGIHSIDFKRFAYGAGSLIPVAPHQVQVFTVDHETHGYMILFTPNFISDPRFQLFSELLLFNTHLIPLVVRGNDMEVKEMTAFVNQMLCEFLAPSDFAKEVILRSLLKMVLIKAERLMKQSIYGQADWNYPLYFRFKQLIESNLTHSKHVTDYCKMLAVSTKKLNNEIKACVGLTAKQMLDERMVLEIKRLLAYSALSVKEIAHALGFDESTNLVKYFRKHTGNTPLHFRQVVQH